MFERRLHMLYLNVTGKKISKSFSFSLTFFFFRVYSLDSSQKEALVEIIATLLKDRSNIVIGSTIMAFNEVCPNRFDLIHPCFRKLCSMLGDCDEWGQMSILNVLIRYGRSQFLNPNPNVN